LTANLVTVAGPTILTTVYQNTVTYAFGMNALGDAVATIGAAGVDHAVRWPAASAMGIEIDMAGASAADINVSGQIAGEVPNPQEVVDPKAVLWTPTGNGTYQTTEVADQLLSVTEHHVSAINDYGQVVGYVWGPILGHKCFLWTPTSPNATTGTAMFLRDLGGSDCRAYDINSDGYVVGTSNVGGGSESHAFLWSPTTPNGTTGTTQDLTPNGGSSEAHAINDARQIGGWRDPGGGPIQGVIWTPLKGGGFSPMYLGDGVYVNGINNSGYAAGLIWKVAPTYDGDAYFWQNGVLTNLPGTMGHAGATAMSDTYGSVVHVAGFSKAGPSARGGNFGQRWDVTVTPLVLFWPLAAIDQGVNQLRSNGTLSDREARAVLGKVDGIARLLDQGQSVPACYLANAVKAQLTLLVRTRRLTNEQAQPLIDLAENAVSCR